MEKNYSYYDKSYVKFGIMQSCKNREVACIPKARAFKIVSSNSLDTILKFVNWKTKPVKIYRSVAKLKEIPMFTFNPKLRSSETGPWFRNDFDNLIYEYDLFLDFDVDKESIQAEIPKALQEVKEVLEVFNQFKVPYYVQFSGNKGFQILIDGQYMPEPRMEKGAVQPAKLVQERLKQLLDLKYLDLSNNGVGNRLCKIPYSLCPTMEDQSEEEMNVALPLSDEQIENFNIADMKLKRIYESVNLYNRGVLERNSELTLEQKRENVRNLIKSLFIAI